MLSRCVHFNISGVFQPFLQTSQRIWWSPRRLKMAQCNSGSPSRYRLSWNDEPMMSQIKYTHIHCSPWWSKMNRMLLYFELGGALLHFPRSQRCRSRSGVQEWINGVLHRVCGPVVEVLGVGERWHNLNPVTAIHSTSGGRGLAPNIKSDSLRRSCVFVHRQTDRQVEAYVRLFDVTPPPLWMFSPTRQRPSPQGADGYSHLLLSDWRCTAGSLRVWPGGDMAARCRGRPQAGIPSLWVSYCSI